MTGIKKAKNKVLTLVLAWLLIGTLLLSAAAETIPYAGYSYDEWNVAIPSKVGYLPSEVYYGDDEMTELFIAPEDFYIDQDGTIYVLDTGNNRIVILDKDFHLVKILDSFQFPDENSYFLSDAKGLFVKDQLLYIADYENMSVIVSDLEGNIRQQITKPDNETFPQESEFRPQKVLVDSQGNIYVLVLGVYQGAAVFNKSGEFTDFFGSNTVKPTLSLLMDQLWKKLMNKTQQDQITNYVPVQFNSFDVTEDDFIYSCTGSNNREPSELRRINPKGDNLWSGISQGDLEIGRYKGNSYPSNFVDVAVTEDDFLFALDSIKGRIFLYDPEGSLVFAFGGKGSQKGTFASPTAIETYGEKVLVLDKSKSSITVFEPTDYGSRVNEALRLYTDGDYDGSRALWESVLREDGNMFTAYIGIGKALYYSGDYKESIQYFREGKARENESKAVKEYRSALLRAAFPYFMTGLCIVLVLLAVLWIVRRRRRKKGGNGRHA